MVRIGLRDGTLCLDRAARWWCLGEARKVFGGQQLYHSAVAAAGI